MTAAESDGLAFTARGDGQVVLTLRSGGRLRAESVMPRRSAIISAMLALKAAGVTRAVFEDGELRWE